MFLNTYEPWKFAFSSNSEEIVNNSWGIIGVPFDSTSTYHTGSRFGPVTIREASFGLEKYNFTYKKELDTIFYDFGDINTIPGNCIKTCEIVEKTILEMESFNIKPLLIGGEHSISYGAIKGVLGSFNDLTILHFDAHRDLANALSGEKFSHGTVFRRVHELGVHELIQIGIRSSSREEEEFVKGEENIVSYSSCDDSVLSKLDEIKTPIYLSIDMDVLDLSLAPDVSNPTPLGMNLQDIESIFNKLIGKNIVGFDIVEAASKELGNTTAITASKIIYDFLTLF